MAGVRTLLSHWRVHHGSRQKAGGKLDVDEAGAIATSLKAKRINPSTKRAYASKVSVMMEWMRAKYPNVVDGQGNPRLPLEKEAVLGFFGHLSEPAHECDTKDIHAEDASSQPLSFSCVEGYRSALVDMYRTQTLELDAVLDTELKSVLEGYEKTINDLKRRGLMDINEGKRHLKSNGYDLLATKLMQQTPDGKGQSWSTVVFAWCYFVLQWNLMRRSDSIDKIMMQHIEWAEDALIVEEQGHKGDQTGADKYGKHVYANPYEPNKCPILALSVLLFSFPERLDNRHQLCVGTDNKGRFGRAIRRVLYKLNDDELQVLGCDRKDIGTHSIRKGSSTYALGQINGPNPVSVYLRMGQSLGRLRDRYIHFGEGRMVAGLPFDSERFGALPPHFDPTVTKDMDRKYWQDLVSGFDRYPKAAQTVFPFLLASLVHHEAYLRSNLDPRHPIFTSRAFTQNPLLPSLRNSTVVAIGVSTVCALKATGIPPHLAIATRVARLADEIDAMKSELKSLPSLAAHAVSTELRESFMINGVAPVTMRDIDKRFEGFEARIVEAIRKESTPPAHHDPVVQGDAVVWKSWSGEDGHICHFAPIGWEFPARITVKAAWDLWQFGDRDTGIRAYKLISQQHDIKPEHQMRYRRVSVVMAELEVIATNTKLIPEKCNVHKLTVAQVDDIFQRCFPRLLARLYPSGKQRGEELACGTLYNKLCVFRKAERK